MHCAAVKGSPICRAVRHAHVAGTSLHHVLERIWDRVRVLRLESCAILKAGCLKVLGLRSMFWDRDRAIVAV
jgi:hypothetical protein